jgi:ABC-type enterochelin transport system permease subunit
MWICGKVQLELRYIYSEGRNSKGMIKKIIDWFDCNVSGVLNRSYRFIFIGEVVWICSYTRSNRLQRIC